MPAEVRAGIHLGGDALPVDDGSIPLTKEDAMSTLHFHQSTASTPEQFIAGLREEIETKGKQRPLCPSEGS